MSGDREAQKLRAAKAAAATVADGAVVGLGSGSTASAAIRILGERVADGLDIVGIATSTQAADTARSVGVPVKQPADVDGIDVAIDGADQVVKNVLIKGGGGAHLREKVVDCAADQFLVIVDQHKVSTVLNKEIPIEVLPDARPLIAESIRALGGKPRLRHRDGYPIITENGNQLVDCDFGEIDNPHELAQSLTKIPGLLEHGLFIDCADTLFIGKTEGVERIDFD